jgi:hypothetical protein
MECWSVTFRNSFLPSSCGLFSQADDLYAFVFGKILAERRSGDIGLSMHETRDRVREQLRHPKDIDGIRPAAIGDVGRICKRADQNHGSQHQELQGYGLKGASLLAALRYLRGQVLLF